MAALEKPGRPLTVEANMGLVRQVAYRFRWALGTVLEEADLMQAGAMGLMRALETYDPELGTLSTYARPWIRVAMQEAISHGRRQVRVPTKVEAKMCSEGEPPPLDGLQLDSALRVNQITDVELTWKDLLQSDDDPTAALDDLQQGIALHDALERLQPRVRCMVRARFFEGLSLRAVGERHNLSRERVRQIVEKGVVKLREYMEEAEMGSMKRKVKKGAERHLRLIKGGKAEKPAQHGELAKEFVSKEGLEHIDRVFVAGKPEEKTIVIGPEAYARLAAQFCVSLDRAKAIAEDGVLSKPVLGQCDAAREEYELEDVACCPRCHAKGDVSFAEDEAGYFEVCCTVRQKLCPHESGPQHPAA